jgi:nicotinamidase-related amidase
MPELKDLLAPSHTAVLVMECQEGIVGGSSGKLGALSDAVRRNNTIGNIRHVLDAARAAGVRIFYLNAARRADAAGSTANCLLLALGKKGEPLVPGSPRQVVVDELAPRESDFVVNRFHGISPFHGTELDSLLRNIGIKTVVATGVSVNVGVTGLTIEAINHGYQVVIPRDAVTGTPDEYVDAVFAHTLRLLATVTDSAEVAGVWAR